MSESQRLVGHLRLLEQAFADQFEHAGLAPLDPEPIIPPRDNTVLFTNSAVISFKPFIRGERNLPAAGAYIAQPCVRAHNLEKVFKETFHPQFSLHFTMVGAIVPADGAERLAHLAVEFFERQGFEGGISHKYASGDEDLGSAVPARVPAECNSERESYYRWGFGEQGLTGRGSTFALTHAIDGVRDVGNLIAFEKDGETVAYGFGIGVESVESCRVGEDWVVRLSATGGLFGPTTVPEAKFVDLVDFLVYCLAQGVTPSRRGRGNVVRRALLDLSRLSAELTISRDEVEGLMVGAGSAQSTLVPSDVLSAALDIAFPAPVERSLLLSFRCPAGLDPTQLTATLSTAGSDQLAVISVEVADRFDGLSSAGEFGLTVEIRAALDSRDAPRDSLARALARPVADLALLGVSLRGKLPE